MVLLFKPRHRKLSLESKRVVVSQLYGAVVVKSYLLSLLFSVAQFSALLWHVCGAVPGGRAQAIFAKTCWSTTQIMAYPVTRMFK